MYHPSVFLQIILISKGMANIKLNNWEKLTFSKLGFFKFKIFVSRSVFAKLQLVRHHWTLKLIVATQKSEIWGKNMCSLFLVMFSFWYISFLTELHPVFSCEKPLFIITHDRKRISKFPQTVFEKILLTKSEVRRSSNWANFWQIFWGRKVK